MFYYIYKIVLTKGSLKDHYYYGQHATNNIDDKYSGSGKILKHYFKKYGAVENETYIKQIISFHKNRDELNEVEIEIIGDKHKTDKLCLNVQPGGYYNEWCDKSRKKASSSAKKRPKREGGSMKGKHQSDNAKKKISEGVKKWHLTNEYKHTEETKQKIREKAVGRPSAWKGHHWNDEQKETIK